MRLFIKFTPIVFLLTNVYGQTTELIGQDTILQLSIFEKPSSVSIPKPIGWINDYEGLYTDIEELVLDSLIRTFKSETGIELAIVTLDTIYCSKDKFDEFTLRIANQWGVGEKGKDNGILIGISRGHRKLRINNGIGIEKLISNSETQIIIDNYFIPYFKNGKYYDGTITGLKELTSLLTTKLK